MWSITSEVEETESFTMSLPESESSASANTNPSVVVTNDQTDVMTGINDAVTGAESEAQVELESEANDAEESDALADILNVFKDLEAVVEGQTINKIS